MSLDSSHTQTVSILGNEYTLKGTAEPERILELARYVDDKLRQTRAKADQPHDVARVAILTSLNIAFELFGSKADAESWKREVTERADELSDCLDRCLNEEGRSQPVE